MTLLNLIDTITTLVHVTFLASFLSVFDLVNLNEMGRLLLPSLYVLVLNAVLRRSLLFHKRVFKKLQLTFKAERLKAESSWVLLAPFCPLRFMQNFFRVALKVKQPGLVREAEISSKN